MKVIVHYKNGKTYEIPNTNLISTWWYPRYTSGGKVLCMLTDIKGWHHSDFKEPPTHFEETLDDVLFIEEVLKGRGKVIYHFNQGTPMSIIPDVMTAQQRAKANRNGIMQMVNNTLSRLKDWKNYGQ